LIDLLHITDHEHILQNLVHI